MAMSVTSVISFLEHSIFIFLAKTFKMFSQQSLSQDILSLKYLLYYLVEKL